MYRRRDIVWKIYLLNFMVYVVLFAGYIFIRGGYGLGGLGGFFWGASTEAGLYVCMVLISTLIDFSILTKYTVFHASSLVKLSVQHTVCLGFLIWMANG